MAEAPTEDWEFTLASLNMGRYMTYSNACSKIGELLLW
jgi:hypothetical protein